MFKNFEKKAISMGMSAAVAAVNAPSSQGCVIIDKGESSAHLIARTRAANADVKFRDLRGNVINGRCLVAFADQPFHFTIRAASAGRNHE